MPKIVILGSCRHEPYDVLAVPEKVPGLWNTEEGYKIATEKFHPAMDEADVIIVFAPDGIIGKHTRMDIDYATGIGKTVYKIVSLERIVTCSFCGKGLYEGDDWRNYLPKEIVVEKGQDAGDAYHIHQDKAICPDCENVHPLETYRHDGIVWARLKEELKK